MSKKNLSKNNFMEKFFRNDFHEKKILVKIYIKNF